MHLYEESGVDCTERLNGMFAFAVWDTRRRRLLLARDRLGKKPLYYAELDGGLLFASELKALLQHPACPTRARPGGARALPRVRVRAFPPRDLRRDPQAARLATGSSGSREGRPSSAYWDLPFDGTDTRPDERDRRRVPERLREAVRLRLVSDVPLGAFLSGGIDSSSIVAFMCDLLPPEQVQTFSIGFTERSFDESEHARRWRDTSGTRAPRADLHAGRAARRAAGGDGGPRRAVRRPVGAADVPPVALRAGDGDGGARRRRWRRAARRLSDVPGGSRRSALPACRAASTSGSSCRWPTACPSRPTTSASSSSSSASCAERSSPPATRHQTVARRVHAGRAACAARRATDRRSAGRRACALRRPADGRLGGEAHLPLREDVPDGRHPGEGRSREHAHVARGARAVPRLHARRVPRPRALAPQAAAVRDEAPAEAGDGGPPASGHRRAEEEGLRDPRRGVAEDRPARAAARRCSHRSGCAARGSSTHGRSSA